MIIFMEDRKFNGKTALKDPKDVARILDQMIDEFWGIESDLGELTMLLLGNDWLQEGQEEVTQVYSKVAERIRKRLKMLGMLNTSLKKFLDRERRPILVDSDEMYRFDMEIEGIGKQLTFYYKKVKGTLFPRFDDEVKQCRDIIAAINGNIDRINEINAAHGIRPLRRVKNLTFKESCSSRNKRHRSV
jgi:hypothetical protein